MGRRPGTTEEGREILDQIRRTKPFLVGSLTVTMKRCGKPRCRCAEEGPIHETALLTWKEENRTRTLYVPRRLRGEVARWVQEARLLRERMERMSEAQRRFLISMREKNRD